LTRRKNITIFAEPKLQKQFHRRLTFFDRHTDEATVKKIIEMDSTIKKVQEKIAFVSQDKETLRAYRMREMALSDRVSAVDQARREGREEIIQLIKEGMPVEEIIRMHNNRSGN
jgi:hypothetical protein